jgi:hypothetical protein
MDLAGLTVNRPSEAETSEGAGMTGIDVARSRTPGIA